MSREIKFRAWDGKAKDWHTFEITDNLFESQQAISFGLCGGQVESLVWQQYTGLKDKNGVEIYDGDILRIGSSLIEEVKWVGVGDWVGAKQPMVGFISHETIYPKPIEVIGNIYETPELLEEVGR